MNRARAKTAPRGREQQQRQEKRSETDELKRRGCDVCADGPGPVVCFARAGRVPRRIVWIEGSGNQTQRQQRSDCEQQDRQDLIATTRRSEEHTSELQSHSFISYD